MSVDSYKNFRVTFNGVPLEPLGSEEFSINIKSRQDVISARLERAFTRAMHAVYAKHKNYSKRIQIWRAKKALMRIANHASKLDWI